MMSLTTPIHYSRYSLTVIKFSMVPANYFQLRETSLLALLRLGNY